MKLRGHSEYQKSDRHLCHISYCNTLVVFQLRLILNDPKGFFPILNLRDFVEQKNCVKVFFVMKLLLQTFRKKMFTNSRNSTKNGENGLKMADKDRRRISCQINQSFGTPKPSTNSIHAGAVGISNGTINDILKDIWGLNSVSSRLVPKKINSLGKACRIKIVEERIF